MADEKTLRRLLRRAVQHMSSGRSPTADFLNECRVAAGMKPRKLDEEGASKVLARLQEAALPDLRENDVAKSTGMTEHRVSRACVLLQQRGLVEEIEQPGLVLYGKRRWKATDKARKTS